MKRRKFLTYSIGTLAGVAGPGRSFAVLPCPPTIDGAPATRPCPLPMTGIQAAADNLAEGEQHTLADNPYQNSLDVQWMVTCIYFDPIRNQIQYMGKSASNQTENGWFNHYLYDCDSDTWSVPAGEPAYAASTSTYTGHLWCHAFDPIKGNYYFSRYNRQWVRKFNPATATTAASVSQLPEGKDIGGVGQEYSVNNTNGPANIFGWHPNLFGAGLPGLFVLNGWGRALAYNPIDSQWHLCQFDNPGRPFSGRENGCAIYIPAIDSLVLWGETSSSSSDDRPLRIHAGAGSATNAVAEGLITAFGSGPPVLIAGKGGSTRTGKICNHPENPNRLLLLERNGGGAVHDSSDNGATWVLRTSGTHPGHYRHDFDSMSSAGSTTDFTIGSLPHQKCVMAITSSGTGGEVRIWKPGL